MLLQRCTFPVIGSPAAAISNVEIAFAENVSSAAAVDSIRAAAAASLGVPASSVTVTVLGNGKVSVAISGTTLTAAQQQAALQQLQQGLADGSVTVAGLTVTGTTTSGTQTVFAHSYREMIEYAQMSAMDCFIITRRVVFRPICFYMYP